jgi:methyl-accepting chemotaxis protein
MNFKNISIPQRIYGLIAIGVVALFAIGAVNYFNTRAIGDDLKRITNQDIPAMRALRDITIEQFEQAILFERATRLAGIEADNSLARLKESSKKFNSHANTVEKDLDRAEKIINRALDENDEGHSATNSTITATTTSPTAEKSSNTGKSGSKKKKYSVEAEYERLSKLVNEISQMHRAYMTDAQRFFEAAINNTMTEDELQQLARKTRAEQRELDTKVANVMEEVSNFTAQGAMRAVKSGQKSQMIVVLVMAGSLLTFGALSIPASQSILNPLKEITGATRALSKGDLKIEIPDTYFEDEIARLSRALREFRNQLVEAERLREEQRAEQQRKLEHAQHLQKMTDGFDERMTVFLKDLQGSLDQMQNTSGDLENLAESGKQQVSNLNDASTRSNQNVDTVASAAEELSASINEISQQINTSTTVSQEAVGKAKDASHSIQELEESAEKIEGIISLIDDIAEKTNLLALNATIEAARAGEAGKGFAVVAGEVKSLAAQTSDATAEIGEQIQGVTGSIQSTVDIIQEVSDIIEKMNEISLSISSAMEEQSAATGEIVQSAQRAAQGTSEVANTAEDVAENTQKTDQAAKEVGEASDDMEEKAVALRGEVETFLSNIKTQ